MMSEEKEIKESSTGAVPTELGTEKIWKLLKSYALPAIIEAMPAIAFSLLHFLCVCRYIRRATKHENA